VKICPGCPRKLIAANKAKKSGGGITGPSAVGVVGGTGAGAGKSPAKAKAPARGTRRSARNNAGAEAGHEHDAEEGIQHSGNENHGEGGDEGEGEHGHGVGMISEDGDAGAGMLNLNLNDPGAGVGGLSEGDLSGVGVSKVGEDDDYDTEDDGKRAAGRRYTETSNVRGQPLPGPQPQQRTMLGEDMLGNGVDVDEAALDAALAVANGLVAAEDVKRKREEGEEGFDAGVKKVKLDEDASGVVEGQVVS